MTKKIFDKNSQFVEGRILLAVENAFHKRLAGLSLDKCLLEDKLALSLLFQDEVANINFNTSDNSNLVLPASVQCSDLSITFNKLKSYVSKRY
jgi:hypothetical protein